MLRAEDAGIDRAVCRTVPDGHRIASTTSVQTLLQTEFDLVVNDKAFRVSPAPSSSALALSDAAADQRLGDVRALVGQLYEALNVEEYYVDQEQKLVKEMESLKQELEPLEKKRAELADKAERRANNLTWVGLGLMSVQFGVLARLTWWEYR
jgi:flagellar motility protein MotE (MotC chaperone)